jgi:hypothetical protein
MEAFRPHPLTYATLYANCNTLCKIPGVVCSHVQTIKIFHIANLIVGADSNFVEAVV